MKYGIKNQLRTFQILNIDTNPADEPVELEDSFLVLVKRENTQRKLHR